MNLYAKLIVRHSCSMIVVVSAISLLCTLLPLLLHDLPRFTDPIVGFETRGTTLAHRFLARENLIEQTRPSGILAADPKTILDQIRMNRTQKNSKQNKTHKKHKNKQSRNNSSAVLHRWANDVKSTNWSSDHDHYGFGSNVTSEDSERKQKKNFIKKQWDTLKKINSIKVFIDDSTYFCGSPQSGHAHLVIKSVDGSSLFSYENIVSMCRLQGLLRKADKENYSKYCERPAFADEGPCCPQWSVSNYIALLANKTTCHDITERDLRNSLDVIKECAPYFHNLQLTSSCSEYEHCRVPVKCSQHDAVYNVLFYLVDSSVFSHQNSTNDFVESAMIFLPIASSSTILPFYENFQNFNMSFESVTISALDFGVKNAWFDVLILRDTWLVGLGGVFVFFCVWVYSGSLILTVMLFIAIGYSLGITYCLYTYVFRLEFFPFMNLLVIVIIIGIGADDAFLYIKVWKSVKSQLITNKDNSHSQFNSILSSGETLVISLVAETLKHSILTIFATSITTAVAFLVSYVSFIPAINCFSIFAGTAVLVNFLLMITLLPATVFLLDTKVTMGKSMRYDVLLKPIKILFSETKVIFNRFIIFTVQRFRFFIVLILGGIGVVSVVMVFYVPGLRLPDSKQFQLFYSSQLFEQYDLKYKDKFVFERFNEDGGSGANMPLYWIWGVKAVDNGNHMDPFSRGHLELDTSFNISDPQSQIWLRQFCSKIKSQPFYQPTLGPLLPNCFIESLVDWMGRKCLDEVYKIDRSPCCESSAFPYPQDIFDYCIIKAAEALYQTPREIYMPGIAGPKFLRDTEKPKVVALIVEFESSVPYTMSYSAMDKFFKQVETWTQKELDEAPIGMERGWFISDLQFYDLQRTLASGTIIALLLSSSLGFLLLLPATLSFVVSICAAVAMIFSVTVTIALLVNIGWKLNILESVAISTSAGLAVDFNLHYALSFTNCTGLKKNRVISALNASVAPTTAAALTTGFAGIFLLYSDILPYSQIGTFLALIMMVSWTYSTLFLSSLLQIFGSDNNKDKLAENRRITSGVSSICSGVLNLESHELEHLGDSNRTIITHPHSPSTFSAKTVVLHEELESLDTKIDLTK